MKQLSFFAFLLLIFFVRVQVNCQEPDEEILTAEDFEDFRMIEGPQMDEETFLLKVSDKLPPYQFRIVPLPPKKDRAEDEWAEHPVGRIEISAGDPLRVVQTIQVDTRADAGDLRHFFQVMDINFDGYLDVAVVDDWGAKWVRQKFWLFDQKTGRFITNSLTDDLHRLGDNGLDLDENNKEITAKQLTVTPGIQSRIYRIKNGHLELVGWEETEPTDTGMRIFVKRLANGKPITVDVWEEDFHNDRWNPN
jgi:hypothetical protein